MRTKKLNIVVTFDDTGYVINDLIDKTPRFELYHVPTKKVVKKSNNPNDFDNYMLQVWKERRDKNYD